MKRSIFAVVVLCGVLGCEKRPRDIPSRRAPAFRLKGFQEEREMKEGENSSFSFQFLARRSCAARRDLISYTSAMERLEFESAGRKALMRRGRGRAGAFAHGSSTPPPAN